MTPQVNKQPINELVPKMVMEFRRLITKDDEISTHRGGSSFMLRGGGGEIRGRGQWALILYLFHLKKSANQYFGGGGGVESTLASPRGDLNPLTPPPSPQKIKRPWRERLFGEFFFLSSDSYFWTITTGGGNALMMGRAASWKVVTVARWLAVYSLWASLRTPVDLKRSPSEVCSTHSFHW